MNKTLSNFEKKCYNDMKRFLMRDFSPRKGDVCVDEEGSIYIANGKTYNDFFYTNGLLSPKNEFFVIEEPSSYCLRFSRFASRLEREEFFEAMKKAGCKWDEKKKELKWRAEHGDLYYYIDEEDTVKIKRDIYTDKDTQNFLTSNYFKTDTGALKYLKEVRSKLRRFSDKSEANKELKELYKNSSDEVRQILENKFTIGELSSDFIPKNGDICIRKDGNMFIASGKMLKGYPCMHGGISNYSVFLTSSDGNIWEQGGYRQSTQEEKDYFFKKMRGYGYQWDEEKKNFRKKIYLIKN